MEEALYVYHPLDEHRQGERLFLSSSSDSPVFARACSLLPLSMLRESASFFRNSQPLVRLSHGTCALLRREASDVRVG